ncbi:DnaJ-domain-containing protein [Delitschia confertaspora ATCC 74209]|uniref:DnaJ-domain-containing protein n=1 Tax=Delitschia confertaspora ATCC 74209 TaxID=1513339 RepID=A0A9P4JIK8_9PLEO|nr:DnaJ-domain-containing protein [Delitschia confertaspora ATCC 74209]
MPLRPPRFQPIIRPSLSFSRPQWHIHPDFCLPQSLLQHQFASHFHTSWPLNAQPENTPNHYETLQIPLTATPAEIKRQFFSLSKLHHPDHNPDDPTAATRFVQISEAYHCLSVPEKRAQYDHELHAARHPHHARGHTSHPSGSYSSASWAGSRPATGLNKRRSTFRGPPPSFFKSGGYGKHGAKRSEYQYQNAPNSSAEAGAEAENEESYGGFGGYGPGQTRHGYEVPHFNDLRHKKTHQTINEYIHARRAARAGPQREEELDKRGLVLNFVLIGGALSLILWSVSLTDSRDNKAKKSKRDNKD